MFNPIPNCLREVRKSGHDRIQFFQKKDFAAPAKIYFYSCLISLFPIIYIWQKHILIFKKIVKIEETLINKK